MENNVSLPVYMPGLDEKLLAEVEERVSEFERDHEQDVIHGRNGYVDRIQTKDYVIAIVINAVLGIYWLWSILT
jgi:hypothetical protein